MDIQNNTPFSAIPRGSFFRKLAACVPLLGIRIASASESSLEQTISIDNIRSLNHYKFCSLVRVGSPVAASLIYMTRGPVYPQLGIPMGAGFVIPMTVDMSSKSDRELLSLGWIILDVAMIALRTPSVDAVSAGAGIILGATLRILPDVIDKVQAIYSNTQSIRHLEKSAIT